MQHARIRTVAEVELRKRTAYLKRIPRTVDERHSTSSSWSQLSANPRRPLALDSSSELPAGARSHQDGAGEVAGRGVEEVLVGRIGVEVELAETQSRASHHPPGDRRDEAGGAQA